MPVATPSGAAATSSDLEITKDLHAHFRRDGKSVSLDFYIHDPNPDGVRHPRHFEFSHDDAVRVGKQIEESGSWGEFPIIAEISVVRAFGRYLREYAEK
jgi:hypothetical protein